MSSKNYLKDCLLEVYDKIFSSPEESTISISTIREKLGCTLQVAKEVFECYVIKHNLQDKVFFIDSNGEQQKDIHLWEPKEDIEEPAFLFRGRLGIEQQKVLLENKIRKNIIEKFIQVWNEEKIIWYAILDIVSSQMHQNNVDVFYNNMLMTIRNCIKQARRSTGDLKSYIINEVGDAFKFIFIDKNVIIDFFNILNKEFCKGKILNNVKFRGCVFNLPKGEFTNATSYFSMTNQNLPEINTSKLTEVFRVESTVKINENKKFDKIALLFDESILNKYKKDNNDFFMISPTKKHIEVDSNIHKMYPIVWVSSEEKIEGFEAKAFFDIKK